MSVEGELRADIMDQKSSSVSPSIQSDLSMDGDNSTNHNSSSSDKFLTTAGSSCANSEPKAKKRRKQSNPLKIQNAASPEIERALEMSTEDMDLTAQQEIEANQIHFDSVEPNLLSQSLAVDKSKTEHASQKNSISRVANALYNNKIKEASKAAKMTNKSKESSLQSIADLSSPESNDEIMSSTEFKNSIQNMFSQLPPILPIQAEETAKLCNMYSFTDFSPPVQQGGSGISVSSRSFMTSNGVRVFNPEAYCELCEKEFCNKYFLKTHKANKHGICSTDNNQSGYNYRSPYKAMQVNPQVAQQMFSQMCENGATFGSADSYCNICQKYFCNKYFLKKHRQNIHGILENQDASANIPNSIHVPVISSPMPVARSQSQESKSLDSFGTKDEDSKINVSLENIKNSLNCLSSLNGSSPVISSKNKNSVFISNQKEKKNEKFLCELCNIEFCDKFYLESHKQNKHPTIKVEKDTDPAEGKMELGNATKEFDESKDGFKGQMCTPCMKNFSSAEAFQNHMLEAHGAVKEEEDNSRLSDVGLKRSGNQVKTGEQFIINKKSPIQDMENSNSSTDSVSFNCNICFAKCKDKANYIIHMESEHNIAADTLNLMQDNDNQCDVCQELFPDRLTLISHKLKAHGIISPGLNEALNESFENDSIRRIDGEYTYTLGSRQKSASSFCQICNKELCNKYFMKTHMLKMHGIDVDKTQLDRTPNISGGVYCDICQKFLSSKYFLKIHKQNVHRIFEDSPKPPVLGIHYNISLGVNEKKTGNALAKINNSSIGKEDSLKRNSNGGFSCDLCGQEFLSKLLLQVHLVNKHLKCSESKALQTMVMNAYSQLAEDSKEAIKSGNIPCSCCTFTASDDSEISQETKLVTCHVCNVSYHQSDYYTHHLSHGTVMPPSKKQNVENGIHEPNGHNHSGNNSPDLENKEHPRKFKRFRCSKCDKTFRTKTKCLNHIQVRHKSKKSVSNQTEQSASPLKRRESKSAHAEGMKNGIGISAQKLVDGVLSAPEMQDLPMPVPYVLPKNSDVIMQRFHLSEPKPEGATKQDMFVPSVVYLPVSQKISEPVTVAFTLTPA